MSSKGKGDMPRCFVIQPFDKGVYDKRYRDVLKPAVKSAGLEPYRVDEDPNASIPIEKIEEGIRASAAVLADITENNPNVWFEVGYAIAAGKEVVFICSDDRDTPFPFDVQHRSIIKYETESVSDFETLQQKLVPRLKAVVRKSESLAELAALSPIKDQEGLTPFEISALVIIMENRLTPETYVEPDQIKQDMRKLGYRDIAVSLSLTGLVRKGMIEPIQINGEYGAFTAYLMTEKGVDWIMGNQDKLVLENPKAQSASAGITDKDIPF
jgi:nucleoside 2-deoxyribosyltransferase